VVVERPRKRVIRKNMKGRCPASVVELLRKHPKSVRLFGGNDLSDDPKPTIVHKKEPEHQVVPARSRSFRVAVPSWRRETRNEIINRDPEGRPRVRHFTSGLYQGMKVEPKIIVAAIVSLADKLEQFKRSKNETPAEETSSNELTKGKLQGKLHKVLSSAGDHYEEKAQVIYRTLASLE
jgi:hypothetical protein